MLSGVRQPPSQPQSTSTSTTPASTPSSTTPAGSAASQPAPTSTFESQPTQPTQPTQQPATTPTTTPETPPAGGPAPWSFSAAVNANRAKATRDALEKYAGGDQRIAQRLTPSIVDALVDGVATPRTNSIIGQEGVLGRRQAMDAARTLAELPQPLFDRVSALLDSAGKGPDGTVPPGASLETERALILKALSARSGPLSNAGSQEQAMGELEWFAGAIRGQARNDVIAQTSVVDVNDQANTSNLNPLDSTVTNDQRADNDGYAQRFTSSCAPAVAAMVRGEADPVFAMMLNGDGLQNSDPAAGASQLEKRILERDRFFSDASPEVTLTQAQLDEYQKSGTLPEGVYHLAGSGVSRVGQQARKVMDDQLDQAVKGYALTQAQADALRKDAQGGTLSDTERVDRDAALKVVREGNNNHPTDFELAAMRSDRPREQFMLIAHALRDLASGVTHQDYWDWSTKDGVPQDTLANMERAVASGLDLPIRLSTPGQDGGHFMVVTDVRNQEGGGREFLVADPWSGRSTWLKEADFANPKSDWPRREFNVFWQQVTDVFAPLDFPVQEALLSQ